MNEPTTNNGKPEPLAEARNRLMALPADQAVRTILDHPRAGALARSLSDQDFRLLMLENGPADSLELVALASDTQWRHILDVEAWQGDQLSPALLTRWLGLLAAASPDRAARWLLTEEKDTARWWLAKHLFVYALAEDEDPADLPEGCFSLDGVLYLKVRPGNQEDEPEVRGQEPFIKAMLERMAGEDYDTLQRLLFEAGGLLPAEAEEELLRLRGVRLAERGFPPFHEAVSVYRHVSAGQVEAEAAKAPPLANDPVLAPIPPVSPGQALAHDNLLSRSLSVVDTAEAAADLQAEFASLANQVACADQNPVASREELGRVVKKTAGYVSLGLSALSGDDPSRAAGLLFRLRLADLFSLGFSRALELKFWAERWRKTAWFARRGLALTFFGEEGLGVLGGLFLKRPLYYDPKGGDTLYRDFERPGEIEQTRAALEGIMAADSLFSALDPGPGPIPKSVTHKSLLLTLWARHELGLEGIGPLGRQDLSRFLSGLWEEESNGRRLRQRAKASFLAWLVRATGRGEAEILEKAGAFLEGLFRELGDELSGVDPAAPDPRFILLFWTTPLGD